MVLSLDLTNLETDIQNMICWLEDKNEIKHICSKGLYLFRKKNTDEILYIGVGGTKTKDIQFRVNQYYTPCNEGSKFFKCKVLEIEGDSVDIKWDIFKREHQKNWENIIQEFQVGVIPLKEYGSKELLYAEALAIGAFKPKLNF
ncbi:hypothetical protein ACWOC1_04575 [Enterococcus quebecensis]|uniref:GIY-YIG domain-containing protein n=1 Tax=Enterococcus quebecensis TaxID=903983 RepID=A0A1E5GWK9_9ENTE|nr:hypothetical protein [Enterococcus quebecensis]OEG17098.1 hypothetical protein BCR23_03585 [Enterococcus quebecensis]